MTATSPPTRTPEPTVARSPVGDLDSRRARHPGDSSALGCDQHPASHATPPRYADGGNRALWRGAARADAAVCGLQSIALVLAALFLVRRSFKRLPAAPAPPQPSALTKEPSPEATDRTEP